ncbi:AT-rich interactive domain-containing protein 2 [Apophysomyces ossiformis]|uniref:AT-rich interactive domain-containing protein 2 n=1 Tax=Apophysomyces ossiformis TaxID=679940 RepID=A0A8H7BQJ3_9FUNG|nr:AT-rich interactive domain-containing protein 2 [Apophysomyces ossiformis]
MPRWIDTIERTREHAIFMRELKAFHDRKGTTLQAEPILGGKRLDLLKIYKVVVAAGGFEQLGWEEENLWGNEWIPPKELFGPSAHRSSTLAGKSYKSAKYKDHQEYSTENENRATPLPDSAPPKPVSSGLADSPTSIKITGTESATYTHPQQCHQKPHPRPTDTSSNHIEADGFNHITKQKILFALQFGEEERIEWALDRLVTLSFESCEGLQLSYTPILLDFMLALSQPFLETHIAKETAVTDTLDQMMNTKSDGYLDSSKSLGRILKILHIIRNLSLFEKNIPFLSRNGRLKKLLTKILGASSCYFELSRHCIDILENIACHTELASSSDDYITALSQGVYSQDRYLIVGTIRTFTAFSFLDKNLPYMLTGLGIDITAQVAQFLLANDEELVGAALEYLYLRSLISRDCRTYLLEAHSGTYIRLLVSLSTFESKFFRPRFVKQCLATHQQQTKHNNKIPLQLPDLNIYHQLDEPFRCLGWLKDKFEVANPSSHISLDDIYLLYESRFRREKALKMREFYTVLKIAFLKTLTSQSHMGATGPVLEGLLVRGIQVKMNILQDECSDRNELQDENLSDIEQVLDGLSFPDISPEDQFQIDTSLSLQHHQTHLNDKHNNNITSSNTDTLVSSIGSRDPGHLKGVALVAMHLLQELSGPFL